MKRCEFFRITREQLNILKLEYTSWKEEGEMYLYSFVNDSTTTKKDKSLTFR